MDASGKVEFGSGVKDSLLVYGRRMCAGFPGRAGLWKPDYGFSVQTRNQAMHNWSLGNAIYMADGVFLLLSSTSP